MRAYTPLADSFVTWIYQVSYCTQLVMTVIFFNGACNVVYHDLITNSGTCNVYVYGGCTIVDPTNHIHVYFIWTFNICNL